MSITKLVNGWETDIFESSATWLGTNSMHQGGHNFQTGSCSSFSDACLERKTQILGITEVENPVPRTKCFVFVGVLFMLTGEDFFTESHFFLLGIPKVIGNLQSEPASSFAQLPCEVAQVE